MANELTVTQSFSYTRGNFAALARAITALGVNVSSDPLSEGVLTVATTDTVIPLGSVTLAGNWAWFKNLDSTNFLQLRVAAAGNKFCKLKPGEGVLMRLGTDITAPVAIADTAACSLEFVIFSA